MGDDPKKLDARRLILARRATFIAAALAGVGCQKEAEKPQAPMTQEPAGSTSSTPDPPADAGEAPRPCLKVGQPEACLKIAPPRDQK